MLVPDKIIVADRFAALRTELLHLLAGLDAEEWALSTAAPLWSVKDIVAHLLGGDVAILSGKRDGFRLPHKVDSNEQLIKLVDRLNAEWVLAMHRVSPQLLCELLAVTGPEVESCFSSLDPLAMGGSVSWVGPSPAPVWLDLAREFTERWHHQQQIRDATGRPPLYAPYFFGPVLDAFVRALPHSFRALTAPLGTSVMLEISGEAGGTWFVYLGNAGWVLLLDTPTKPAGTVTLPQDVAWRLFTKGIDREKARSLAVMSGDVHLVEPIFATTSVIG